MGNILPEARKIVLGRAQRGQPGDGAFQPTTGAGYVAPAAGQYTWSLSLGIEVLVLLFSTLGGFSPDVLKLVQRAAESRGNKFKGSEWDDTTWSARSWTSYTMQRLSCELTRACAQEVAIAMRLPRTHDARARRLRKLLGVRSEAGSVRFVLSRL